MAQPGEPSFQINVSMTSDQAVEFLDRLANDDDFRARFEEDTQAALAEYGIDAPAEAIPDVVVAPPKGLLHEASSSLKAARGVEPEPYAPAPFGPAPFSPYSAPHSYVFLALSRAQRPS